MSRCFYADTLRPVPPFFLIGPGQAFRVPITMPSALFLILNLEPWPTLPTHLSGHPEGSGLQCYGVPILESASGGASRPLEVVGEV